MDMEFTESPGTPLPNRPSRAELRGAIGFYFAQYPMGLTEKKEQQYTRRVREAGEIIRREQEAYGKGLTQSGLPESLAEFATKCLQRMDRQDDTGNH